METFCHIQVDESGKSETYCNYCMCAIFGFEKAWVSKNGRYFCCWECIEEYEAVQRSY